MNYNQKINIFTNPDELSQNLAVEFVDFIRNNKNDIINILLAGGSTPKIFYSYLALDKFKDKIEWGKVHFYWGDERCVSPDHSDSNYLMVKKSLLDKIDIPKENIHRIYGENSPEKEISRYSNELLNNLTIKENIPIFDWVFLGLGNDGHTASLFPNSKNLNNINDLCVVEIQPESGQRRISLSLPILKNAQKITFLVTGRGKAEIIKKLLIDREITNQYPASLLFSKNKNIEWCLDVDSAKYL